ncbi:MAG: isochorismate synthase [Actinomycetota bacterium]|nr:isochorismate synthase [Actinomycetota bacterium]
MLSRDRRSPVGSWSEETGSSRARWLLADRVSRTLSKAGVPGLSLAEERVVRIAVPAGRVNPFRWLGGQPLLPKLYWSGREDGLVVAAVGVADLQEGDVLEGTDALHKRLSSLLASGDPQLRYYGGMRFDPTQEASAEWAAFRAYRFVLPRFELLAGEGEATLVCNLVLPRDAGRHAEILDEIEHLSFPREASDAALPAPLSRTDAPDPQGWRSKVELALSAFSEGRLGKVVLARRVGFGFAEKVDASLLAERLREAAPGCFHFYVEPGEGVAFVGASPERLFRREGRSIQSEAVAGTRPRGASEADDAELRDELLRSEKDRSEHDYVRISVKESLEPLCDELEVEEDVSEMKLLGGRHLRSGVRGTLRKGATDAEVLHALHPTPAVGGYPRQEALEEILALEPFDRGWYAGPVGWIGANGSEFAVGIRSGLVRGNRLALFSGAGIVEGSVPEDEWEEIEQKIGDFLRVFGLEPGHLKR